MKLIFLQQKLDNALFVNDLGEIIVQVVPEDEYKKQVLKGYVPINDDNAAMYVYVTLKSFDKSEYTNAQYIESIQELLENEILNDSSFCQLYATETLKKRFIKAEKYILTSPDAVMYALAFPVQEVMEVILKDMGSCRLYAMLMDETNHSDQVLQVIKNDAGSSTAYAIKINKRFLMGEEVISKDTEYGMEYAREILKGRFPAYEKYHRDNIDNLDEYDLEAYQTYNNFFDIK